ncbi:MAG TPA: aldo/keto reductase [Sandaracinaceae bacterium LLY-WYZ-13_1]|nr:aldo/keto reductase [Sandaracinaceae bacterium LLY-WYZ-13_1]
MEYVDVGGARIPKIGLGTWQLTGEACRDVVEKAIAAGYRHIDTAQMYENEAKVGAAIAASGVDRDALWVTTKLGLDQVSADAVGRSTHDSLRRLGLDYVDLLLIHWPSEEVPLRETLGAMQRLQETGEVRHLGVSNFTPSLLEEARELAPIVCNQVEYHPFLSQDALRTLCDRHELMLTAYSPLARGEVAKNETLRAIGERHGKSAVQVGLRWLTQQKNVAAIPKTSDPDHLKANLEIFDFELDADDANRIAKLARGERLIDPSWAPEWGT